MGLTRIRAEQISDIDYKQAVRVVATNGVVLSGGAPNAVDGVNLLVNDRVLVTGQANGSQNGLYRVQALGQGENGTWVRTSDANAAGEIEAGMLVMVTEGITYKDTLWKLVTNNPIEVGVTALTFELNTGFGFGNIYANGTGVTAAVQSDVLTLTAGDNMTIVGNAATKTITFSATGGGSTDFTNIESNVIPAANLTYSLGNATNQWANIYVGGNTIYLGNLQLKDSGSNTFAVYAADGTTPATISATVTASDITGTVANATYATSAGSAATATSATTAGTVTSATQANITAVGNLVTLIVDADTTDEAVRITQIGTGNALKVEDEANPDATPFVIAGNGSVGVRNTATPAAITANGKMVLGDSINNANIANVLNFGSTSGAAGFRPINLIDTSAVIKVVRLDNTTNGPGIELQQWDTTISNQASYWDMYTTSAGFGIRDRSTPATDRLVIDNEGRVLIGSNASITTNSANLIANVANLNLQVLGSAYVSGNIGIATSNISAPFTLAYTSGTPNANLMTTDAAIITANASAPGFAFVVAGNVATYRGVFKGTRARGTLESPLVPQENDAVVTLLGAIYDGNVTRATAGIELTVDGTVSDGVAPQRIAMLTGNTNTRVERVSIYGNGVVNVRSNTNSTSSTTGALTVSGGIGVVNDVYVGGLISAAGNVSANYFSGNGSQLTGISASPGGSTTEVQYNNSGALAGSSNFTFDGANVVVAGNITGGNVIAAATSFSAANANGSIGTISSTASWPYETSFSVSAQDTEPRGVFFKSDGTRMFVVGQVGDDIIQYDLSVAWDVSSAVYGNAYVVSAQGTTPYDVSFKDDGTAMYVLDGGNDTIFQYTLSSAWDVGSASYATKSFSVAAQEATPAGMWFKPDGTKMYIIGTTGDDVNEYDLGTAWDISTASYLQVSPSLSTWETSPDGLAFSADGTKMWTIGPGYNRITQFNLDTAWNVTTATFGGYLPIAGSGPYFVVGSSGLYVNLEAGVAYVTDYQNDRVFQYSTDTPTGQLYGPLWTTQTDLNVGNNLAVNSHIWIGGTGRIVGGFTSSSSISSPNFATTSATATTSLITGTTTGALNFATGMTSGILTIGGTAQTGNIVLGRSTANNRIIIGGGVTASGATQTIDFGVGGAAGSNTNINIGSSNTSGAVTTITIAGNIVNGQANGVGNIGSSTSYFNTVFAKATSAQYADLAEIYTADADYPAGTVVAFGGSAEITQSLYYAQTSVAGVVSTNPAYVMNAGAPGLPVALQGRVPCRVTGTIRKGDLVAASDTAGVATKLDPQDWRPGSVIGKALGDHDGDAEGVIEVVVGRV